MTTVTEPQTTVVEPSLGTVPVPVSSGLSILHYVIIAAVAAVAVIIVDLIMIIIIIKCVKNDNIDAVIHFMKWSIYMTHAMLYIVYYHIFII